MIGPEVAGLWPKINIGWVEVKFWLTGSTALFFQSSICIQYMCTMYIAT